MKYLLTIFFLSISFIVFGQKCDTLKGKIVNCIDTIGRKQGHWIVKKKNEAFVSEEGNYKDDKKIGDWIYYKGDHLVWDYKHITYHNNGKIKEENYEDKLIVGYNQDSSKINGYSYYWSDTIFINCQNQKGKLTMSPYLTLIEFDFTSFDQFEHQLHLLQDGVYCKKMQELKKHK